MERLIDMERRGWAALTTDSADTFYDKVMTPNAIMVVPGAILDREQVLHSWKDMAPWAEYELRDERVIPVHQDAALLVYHASARRDGQEAPYRAIMTSLYVRVGDTWQLAFHQQTPVAE
jgi:hypothetical protein